MELGAGVTIGLAVFGAIVWAVRQEGRVNNHDALHQQHAERDEQIRMEALTRDSEIRSELAESKLTASARYVELRDELRYFRQRVDAWTGANKGPYQ